jgi:aminoglycoside phosphotransferase (APT) family kinase protein
VHTPPPLSDAQLTAVLATGWGVAADRIAHLPVGFGSHHWEVRAGAARWFLTVDDLVVRGRANGEPTGAAARRLRDALATARELADAGLGFVVAPLRSLDGDVLVAIGARFAASLYPYVVGEPRDWGEYGSRAERMEVLERVVAVHDATSTHARADDLTPPAIDELHAALDALGTPWDGGPYGERARQLLRRHAVLVARLIELHERFADAVRRRPERYVLTHGEPHPGNTIVTSRGVVLVDWDTVLVAPPERDLWILAGDDAAVLDAYTAATGRPVLPDALTCYRVGWDLGEIACYVGELRDHHPDTEDTAASWRNLRHYLDPRRPWGDLVRST